MSKLDLIIAAKEMEYVRRLADYVRESAFGKEWRVTAFTHPGAFRQYIKGGYSVHIIAAQPEMLEEIHDCMPAVPIATLVTSLSKQDGELLQYQPLPQLLKSLISMYGGLDKLLYKSNHEGSSGANVITIYDSVGGLGKTTLAMELARQMGTRGERVFYLNLELWNVTHLLLDAQRDTGLADTLYLLHTQPEAARDKLCEVKKNSIKIHADYFAPGLNSEERMVMTPQDARKLIDLVAHSALYDVVIADLDSRLDPLTIEMFERSDAVLWLVGESEATHRKTELASQYASWKFPEVFDKVKGKIRYIGRRHAEEADGIKESRSSIISGIVVCLPHVPEWTGGRQEVGSVPPPYRGAVERLLAAIEGEGEGDRARRSSGTGAASKDSFTA